MKKYFLLNLNYKMSHSTDSYKLYEEFVKQNKVYRAKAGHIDLVSYLKCYFKDNNAYTHNGVTRGNQIENFGLVKTFQKIISDMLEEKHIYSLMKEEVEKKKEEGEKGTYLKTYHLQSGGIIYLTVESVCREILSDKHMTKELKEQFDM
mgnify:CR=1 FL=1|tara:strand:- start:2983 stop:3429 length:447 start_codon:yes stop_codon:yes gene_type:complete